MKLSKLIATFQSYVSNNFPETKVAVSGGEEMEIPSIIIEDISVNILDEAMSMNGYFSSTYNADGEELARNYRRPYEARISMVVTDRGPIESTRLAEEVHQTIRHLANKPHELSNNISRIEVGRLSGMNHQFVNPSESSYTLSLTATSAFVNADEDFSRIDDIEIELNIQ